MTTDEINLDMFPSFSFDDHTVAEQKASADQRNATAIRTRARIHARRAKAEAHLADILPAVIADGDAWHILSSGDIDSLSYLAHILATQPLEYVALSTWCMAMEDVTRLGGWLANGRIGRLDAYVGEIFPNQYADEHQALSKIVRQGGGALLRLSQPQQSFPVPRRRTGMGHRIQRQHQHQPAHRKHHHHRRPRPLSPPPCLLHRRAQLRPPIRRLAATP